MERERRGGGREARHLVGGKIEGGGGKGCQKEGREGGQATARVKERGMC
jgi:hypothetical protein